MPSITTFLTYDHQAEAAVRHYTSIFENSKITNTMRAGDRVISLTFELLGQSFIALNGGPTFTFAQGISLLGDKDPVKAGRAMQAMLKMQKLDIAELKRAHAGG